MLLFTATSGPFALSRWSAFFANFNQFLKGFFYTLEMSVFALLLSLILGVIFGAMSSSKTRLLKGIARVLRFFKIHHYWYNSSLFITG